MSSTAPTQIDYAPPLSSRRRVVRRWLPRALVITFVASAYYWGPPAWRGAEVLYWQSRCARHTMPAETIVAFEPASSDSGASRASAVIPTEWARFYGLISPPGFQSRGTIFLHTRNRPNGEPVLVAIDYLGRLVFGDGETGPSDALVQIRTFKLGTGMNSPKQLSDEARRMPVRRGAQAFRIFAGQIDPNDTTHFMIRCEADGERQVIDGWILNEGVDLEARAIITPPPPTSAERSPESAQRRIPAPASRRAGG